MKIEKIQIRNILGIDSLEYEPGKITEISGQNGVGKTSFLEAIKGVLGGGHDAKLLRNGATEGEVVLIFDNGECLRKTMTREKSEVKFEDAEGKKIKQGASYIKEIIDPVGLNPIRILTADKKERVNMLLGSVPMELPIEAVKMITGLDISDEPGHPLKVIEEKRKGIFEERAFLNAEVKKQEGMISEMRKTIPFGFKKGETDWAAEVGRLRTELQKKNEGKMAVAAGQAKKFDTDLTNTRAAAQKEIDEIKECLENRLESIREADRLVMDAIDKDFSADLDELKINIGQADTNSKNQDSVRGAQAYVEKHTEEMQVFQISADGFSEQIKSLDALKGEMLLSLPVEGLEVKDGNIFIKGVPFDTLNTAAQIRFCLMIAGLQKTKLPLVCVDGLEALDETVFNIFKAEADKTDMQFFVTRVSEDEILTLV